MGRENTTWDIVLRKQLSMGRIFGFALFWTWMMVTFYSIMPYLGASNVRATLYTSQLFSLAAMVCTVLFTALMAGRGGSIASSRPVVIGGALAMCLGTAFTVLADNTTINGTLLLGFGSVLTGSGSGLMLLCWAETISWQGERLALVELAISSALSFAFAFVLLLLPDAVCDVMLVLLGGATAVCLRRFSVSEDAASFQADEREGSGRSPLSAGTIGLFAKAMCGVALVGLVAGFFDVLSGYKTFVVQDAYGLWLYLAGLLVSLALAVIAIVLHHDGAFFGYRVCMLLICLGCLLTPFLSQSSNVGTLIFGGYHGYALVICSIAIGVATSFRVGTVRAIGMGYVALYGGELVGALVAHGLNQVGDRAPDLALLTLAAVSLLFISHLFLFTETDLVKIGIGEVNLSAPARKKLKALGGKLPGGVSADGQGIDALQACESEPGTANAEGMREPAESDEPTRYMGCAVVTAVADALTSELLSTSPDEEAPVTIDPAPVMIERYGLSPRESDVLPLLLEGRTIARIQEALFISQGTVSTHIRHIYQKTGASNRQDLIDLAQRIAEGEDEPS